MRLALGHIDQYDDKVATFARQLGVRRIHFHCPKELPGEEGYWSARELTALKARCDRDGLTIEAIENVPLSHFWKVQQGADGRDQQLEKFCVTLRNLAAAGIHTLGYNFLPTYVWRTEVREKGRGGALVTSFDLAKVSDGNALTSHHLTPGALLDHPLDADEMWANHG